MRIGGIVMMFLPLVVMCTSEASQCNYTAMVNRARGCYESMYSQGVVYLKKAQQVFETVKSKLRTRMNETMTTKSTESKSSSTTNEENGEDSASKPFDLTEEDIRKMLDDIMKQFTGHTGDNDVEEKRDEDAKPEENVAATGNNEKDGAQEL